MPTSYLSMCYFRTCLALYIEAYFSSFLHVSVQCGDIAKREREIKFIGLFGDKGHRGPYSPYKPCNDSLYIGIIIFPHIDNPQFKGYN